jgi:hypothetical protein
MNSWLPELSLPSQTPKNQRLDEPTQVGFVHLGAVSTATSLVPQALPGNVYLEALPLVAA